MSIAILIILGLIGFVVFVVNKTATNSIKALLEPEKLLEPVAQIDDAYFLKSYEQFNHWAQANGFEPLHVFLFHTLSGVAMNCAAWWSPQQQTWALIYCALNKTNIDFVTPYPQNTAVTTGSTKDAVLLPNPPKAYIQAFTGLTPDALYAKHLTARKAVETADHLGSPSIQDDLFVAIKKSLSNQAQFLMQLPFWQYRGAYWFFVRRHLKVNRPIKPLGASVLM